MNEIKISITSDIDRLDAYHAGQALLHALRAAGWTSTGSGMGGGIRDIWLKPPPGVVADEFGCPTPPKDWKQSDESPAL